MLSALPAFYLFETWGVILWGIDMARWQMHHQLLLHTTVAYHCDCRPRPQLDSTDLNSSKQLLINCTYTHSKES